MSNQIKSMLVIFEENVSEEYAEGIKNAILHMRGVLQVEQQVADFDDAINQARARHDLGTKLFDVIYPKKK